MSDLPRIGIPLGLTVGHSSEPFARSVELAEAFEWAGVDFVSVGDSGAETFALLGAIAARTTRLGVMSGIATWSRSPVTMAHAATTVQNLSAGRYRLGIGPMPRLWAERWHGLAFDPVLERMRDYLTAVRAALDATPEQPTNLTGRLVNTQGFPGHPVTPPRRVPMYLAATQPGMVRLAAELADGVMLNSIHPYDWLVTSGTRLIGQGLDLGGRGRGDIEVGLMRFCAVDDDPRVAYDAVRPAIAFYFAIPYFRALLEPFGFSTELAAGEAAVAAGDDAAAAAAVSDRLVDAVAIAGTPEQVAARITRYAEHVDWLQLAGGFNVAADVAAAQTARLTALIGRLRGPAGGPVAVPSATSRSTLYRSTPYQSAIARRYVGPPGEQIHLREHGSGPAVVLLHQTASSSLMWERVMRLLPGYRTIALDTPGFGASDALLDPAPDIAALAARLRRALDEARIDSAVLVGHHTGAVLAGELALQAPELVTRLVLLGPVVIETDEEMAEQLAHVNRWSIDSRGDYVTTQVIPRLHRSVLNDDPEHMQAELISYLQAGAQYTAAYDAVWRYRAVEQLPRLQVPTVCAVGTEEMAALQAWTVRAAELIPGARLEFLVGLTSEAAFDAPAALAAFLTTELATAELATAELAMADLAMADLDETVPPTVTF